MSIYKGRGSPFFIILDNKSTMEEDENYTVGDIKRILSEARMNPDNHGYSPELIQRFENLEKEWSSSFDKLPIMQISKGVERAIDALRNRNPFLVALENSPHAKLARQVDYIDSMFKVSEKFERAFAESPWIKHARQIDEIAKNLPIAMGVFYENLSLLSEQGWYVSPRPFDDISLGKIPYYLKGENSVEFEEMIVQEIEKVLPELIIDCQNSFPNRSEVFDEIHKLYTHGFYRAVVTMCYTQADGISNDIFKVGFFDKDKNEEYRLKTYIKLKGMEFNHSIGIIRQLTIPTNEITANSKTDYLQEENKMKSSFNRHLVLHGHSTQYGTKLNAIRAICVLDFLQYLTEAVHINEGLENVGEDNSDQSINSNI